MIKRARVIPLLITSIILTACAKNTAPNLQAPATQSAVSSSFAKADARAAKENCQPRKGLEAGLSGNRANFNCNIVNAPDYMRGHDLGERMHRLKEKRRSAQQEVTQAQYTLKRMRQDLRAAPATSQRATILRGEVAVANQEVEQKMFRVRRIDSDIRALNSDVRSFKTQHS